jgi:hypothetical protein
MMRSPLFTTDPRVGNGRSLYPTKLDSTRPRHEQPAYSQLIPALPTNPSIPHIPHIPHTPHIPHIPNY